MVQMNDEEIIDWVDMLNDPRRSKEDILFDLMDHAGEDGMSEADRQICARALIIATTIPSWRTNHMGGVEL